jgi:macrolide-specific efflux system membrane fusion protein
MKFKKTIIAICVIAATGGYFYFNDTDTKKPDYITTKVSKETIEKTVLSTGTISALKQVQVGAQASGQIKVLNVKLGDTVKKGDMIAEIDSLTQENKLKESEASLDNYKAQLKAKELAAKRSKLYYDRQLNLFKNDATSKEIVENAQVDLAIAEADVFQIETQIKQALLAVDTAKLDLGYTKIEAPIDGVIVSIPVEAGQTVNANQTTPTIVEIAQLDKMSIKAEISEGDIVKVKPGMPVYFTILGDSSKKYKSTLKSIDPGPKSLSDSKSTSASSSSTDTAIYYYGVFEVDNPDSELRINMTAQITIVLDKSEETMSLPSSAIRKDKNGTYVVVIDSKGQPINKPVKVGVNNNIYAEIKEGVSSDDNVVTTESREMESFMPRRMGMPR